MGTSSSPLPSACTGDVSRSADGTLEGWCWYPDDPTERATVELVINGKIVRAMRAVLLRTDRRDIGMGDGFYGFRFPLPSIPVQDGARAVLDVRERRFHQVIGRVVLGHGNPGLEDRMSAVASALTAAEDAIGKLDRRRDVIGPIEALGRTLLHLSTRPRGRRTLDIPGLAASLDQVATVPRADLGWCAAPHVSVVVPAAGPISDLAGSLRAASHALRGLNAEFLLLDDGSVPVAALLPTRLRNLSLVRVDPSVGRGDPLNAAAALARGGFLAFARPGRLGPAGLRRAVKNAKTGMLGLDAIVSSMPLEIDEPQQYHGLECVVAREDFAAMGGFDPELDDSEMWEDLIDKACALGLDIKSWAAPRPARLLESGRDAGV